MPRRFAATVPVLQTRLVAIGMTILAAAPAKITSVPFSVRSFTPSLAPV
jgi:hypothetical protein